jgi:hypothetical protein
VAVIERETRVILRYCWKKKRGQFIELAKKNMVLLGRLVGIEPPLAITILQVPDYTLPQLPASP